MAKTTILLVDDDDDFLCALAKRCENIGLEVEQTSSLLSAALITDQRVPDIICVDVRLPTGNGLSFCDAIAADHRTSQVTIVVLTGQVDFETQYACERLHAYYVAKTGDYWLTLAPILRQLAIETLADNRAPHSGALSQWPSTPLDQPFSRAALAGSSSRRGAKPVPATDDEETTLTTLSQRYGALGSSMMEINNALDAIDDIHRLAPDVVVLDVDASSDTGPIVCEMIKSDERFRNIPVIILTEWSETSTIRRCDDRLVYYVAKSADTWELLDPLVRELLHLEGPMPVTNDAPIEPSTPSDAPVAQHEEDDLPNLVDSLFAVLGAGASDKSRGADAAEGPSLSSDLDNIPWVLCIDDDADFSDALKIRLEDHGIAVIRAFNGRDGYRVAFTAPASAILLDFNMPNGQGDYILNRLKDNPVTKDIPVIVITGTKDAVLERRMLAMGAAAFFIKPLNVGQLLDHLTKYVNVIGASDLPEVTESCVSSDYIELSPNIRATDLIGKPHDH